MYINDTCYKNGGRASILNPPYYVHTYLCICILFFKGGSVSTPLNSIENDAITRIGDEFYEVCEAKSQSGKTLWIGIQRDNEGNWTVSRKGIEYFMNQIIKKFYCSIKKHLH